MQTEIEWGMYVVVGELEEATTGLEHRASLQLTHRQSHQGVWQASDLGVKVRHTLDSEHSQK